MSVKLERRELIDIAAFQIVQIDFRCHSEGCSEIKKTGKRDRTRYKAVTGATWAPDSPPLRRQTSLMSAAYAVSVLMISPVLV